MVLTGFLTCPFSPAVLAYDSIPTLESSTPAATNQLPTTSTTSTSNAPITSKTATTTTTAPTVSVTAPTPSQSTVMQQASAPPPPYYGGAGDDYGEPLTGSAFDFNEQTVRKGFIRCVAMVGGGVCRSI